MVVYEFPGLEHAAVGFAGSVASLQGFVAPFFEHVFKLYELTHFVLVWFGVPGVGMHVVGVRRCGDVGNECGAQWSGRVVVYDGVYGQKQWGE